MAQDGTPPSTLSLPDNAQSAGAGGSKQDVLKQLAESGGGDGSLFQQLTSNPFFTAVCYIPVRQ